MYGTRNDKIFGCRPTWSVPPAIGKKTGLSEGTTVNDIALLLHSSTSTFLNYLSTPKDQIPESRENARERQYIRSMKDKQDKMEEARALYAQGHAIDEITRLTGHASLTVRNYLKEEYPVTNGHYDQRRTGKLVPYEKTVIQMRSQGKYIQGDPRMHLSAVKNGIKYPYHNGLAEGSVNKIKLIKRVMYGRNSFLLLKA